MLSQQVSRGDPEQGLSDAPQIIEEGDSDQPDIIIADESDVPPIYIKQASQESLLWQLAYIIPAFYALIDASQTAMGTKNNNRNFAITLIALTYITSLSYIATFTIEKMKTAHRLFSKNKPEEWVELPRGKHYLATGLALTLSTYVIFSESMQAYFFVDSIPAEYKFETPPRWNLLNVFMTIIAAINILFSEGLNNYFETRRLLSGKPFHYANSYSYYVSPTAGALLGGIGTLNRVLTSLVGIAAVLKLKKSPRLYALLTVSMLNGISDFAQNGKYVRDSMDDVFKQVVPFRLPTLKASISATLALAAAGTVAIASQELTRDLADSMAELFEIKPSSRPNTVFDTFAWANATADTVVGGFCLYDPSKWVVDKLANLLNGIYISVAKRHAIHRSIVRQVNHDGEGSQLLIHPSSRNNEAISSAQIARHEALRDVDRQKHQAAYGELEPLLTPENEQSDNPRHVVTLRKLSIFSLPRTHQVGMRIEDETPSQLKMKLGHFNLAISARK